MKEINLIDAKTHFAGVIAEVINHGQEFIVTKRRKKVARIIPYTKPEQVDVNSVIKAMDKLAKEIGKTGITKEDIRKMRDEGASK